MLFERFKFNSFNPAKEVVLQANALIQQLMDLAPSDSSYRATMSKLGDKYLSQIKIASTQVKFSAESDSSDPIKALEALSKLIKKQILEWKSSRNPFGSGRSKEITA